MGIKVKVGHPDFFYMRIFDSVYAHKLNISEFEKSITTAEFIEHGELEGHYYGTSFKGGTRDMEIYKTIYQH